MRIASLVIVASLGLIACGSEGGSADDATEIETEGELSTASRQVAGAYVDDGRGTTDGIGTLVLKTDGTFFSDVDTGVRCVRAPCPGSSARVEGTYSASSKTVTLRSTSSSAEAQAVVGRYAYKKSGSALELTHAPQTAGSTLKFMTVPSYCTSPDDCKHQNMLVPACTTTVSFLCSSTGGHSCTPRCDGAIVGPPP